MGSTELVAMQTRVHDHVDLDVVRCVSTISLFNARAIPVVERRLMPR